jgi:FdhD protein
MAQAAPPPGADTAALPAGDAADASSAGVEVGVERWVQGESSRTTDKVAEEVPIALMYHGVPHVVMLATPANLTDLAYGFTLSEELVAGVDEIRSVEIASAADSVEVRISIA